MTPRGWLALVALVLTGLGVATAAMFAMQNADRKVQLSLELPFHVAKWQFAEPIPALWLIGGAFGIGFLLATLIFGVRAMGLSSRVRRLERDLALTSRSSSSSSTDKGDGWK